MDDNTVRLDDLQYKGLFLYQQANLPCFTQDSVLLAGFVDLREKDNAVDIGAGTGVLATLLHARTGARLCCIENNPALCALLRASIAYNGQDIPVYEMDWAEAATVLPPGSFTAAICNPPYFKSDQPSPQSVRAAARSGEHALSGAIGCAAKLLGHHGRLYLCYPAPRLTDALCTLREAGLEPKCLRLVAYNAGRQPYLALIMACKAGRPGMKILPALLLKEEDGQDSGEVKRIYHIGEKQAAPDASTNRF